MLEFIDWAPFFTAWELKGKYPKIFDDPHVGAEARKTFDEAQVLLRQIIADRSLHASAVYGFFPANSVGDDVVVFRDDTRSTELARFPMLRQQWEREGQKDFRSLADYVAPIETAIPDFIGAFAVTTGVGIEPILAKFRTDFDEHSAIMTQVLSDRLAEAFAELLHKRVRRRAGALAQTEKLSAEDMIHEKYRGIRPAARLSRVPRPHGEGYALETARCRGKHGIRLTESFAMYPAASVSGLYFAHPESRYFSVDMITRDQVESYASRKRMPMAEIERRPAPNLAYDPAKAKKMRIFMTLDQIRVRIKKEGRLRNAEIVP